MSASLRNNAVMRRSLALPALPNAKHLLAVLLFCAAFFVPQAVLAHGTAHASDTTAELAQTVNAAPVCPNGGGTCCCSVRSCCLTPAQTPSPHAPSVFLLLPAVALHAGMRHLRVDAPRRLTVVLDTTGPRPPPPYPTV